MKEKRKRKRQFLMMAPAILACAGCGAGQSGGHGKGEMPGSAVEWKESVLTITESGISDETAIDTEDSVPKGHFLKDVLLGDARFLYGTNGKAEAMDITDVPSLFDEDDPYMKVWEFSVTDLDGDGEEEVILFVCGVAGDRGGKLIFHQAEGEVYGYRTDNRNLVDLKEDGTYGYSDSTGTAEAGYAVMTGFSETGYTIDNITYATGTQEGWDAFVVDHETAAEEEYLDAMIRQAEKQNVQWHEFTDENIEKILK